MEFKRQDHRRITPQEKLKNALAGKPSAYQFTPKGLVIGSKNPSLVPRNQTTSNVIRQRHIRTPKEEQHVLPQSPTVALFTGGIGDFLAVESFIPDIVRKNLRLILLATRAENGINQLIRSSSIYQDVEIRSVWKDFTKRFCFYCREEVIQQVPGEEQLQIATDYSIAKVFPEIDKKSLYYTGSSFISNNIADDLIHISTKYFVICPYTINDKRMEKRDFQPTDWQDLIHMLEDHNHIGVVLNVGNDPVPVHPLILNLSNQTSFPESVEILKHSAGYYGIDSSLSVIASKLFVYPYLLVKSENPHLYNWKHVYYSPQDNFRFLTKDLGKELRNISRIL